MEFLRNISLKEESIVIFQDLVEEYRHDYKHKIIRCFFSDEQDMEYIKLIYGSKFQEIQAKLGLIKDEGYFEDLPPELHDLVASQLDIGDIHNLRLVSKSVSQNVDYAFYKESVFDYEKIKNESTSIKRRIVKLKWFNGDFKDLDKFRSLRSLSFDKWFNQDTTPLQDLVNLTSLKFGGYFNQDVTPLQELVNLTSLTFGWLFNHDVAALQGLVNLTSLEFGGKFNQDITPLRDLANLTSLKFGYNFHQDITPLKGLVNLTSLEFGGYFHQDITQLKGLVNLTSLEFGEEFNRDITPLQGLTNLTLLKFGHKFTRGVDVLDKLVNNGLRIIRNNRIYEKRVSLD